MNNTIPFHSATHAPQITVDVNILTMLKQAASCLTEAAGKDVYLAAIGPDMELTIIMEEDAPSVLPCFDEDDALISVKGAPLFISYNPAQVLKLAGKRYLTGPVIFYRTDGHSTIVSLTVEDIYRFQTYLENHSTKEGLLPVEKTVIDRCVHLIYRKYFADPCPENMPILEDLYNALLQQDEKEAHHVATALEIYVKGSLNLFNHRTNVNVNNRIVCYDIKELGKQMKKLGMLIVQDQVWGRVTANRSSGKSTRYYMDEMHLLLKEEQAAAYSVEIWKRFRKWGGIPTGLT